METHLQAVHAAAADVELIDMRADQARAALVETICRAMAAGVPPVEAAAAAGMNVAELFDALRRHGPGPTWGTDPAGNDDMHWL